jgi:hypothetical protein
VKVFFGVAGSFLALCAVIFLLAAKRIVGPEVGLLMIVALFALYVGFGFLIVVYRLIHKLE